MAGHIGVIRENKKNMQWFIMETCPVKVQYRL
jgi:hypothetical protein